MLCFELSLCVMGFFAHSMHTIGSMLPTSAVIVFISSSYLLCSKQHNCTESKQSCSYSSAAFEHPCAANAKNWCIYYCLMSLSEGGAQENTQRKIVRCRFVLCCWHKALLIELRFSVLYIEPSFYAPPQAPRLHLPTTKIAPILYQSQFCPARFRFEFICLMHSAFFFFFWFVHFYFQCVFIRLLSLFPFASFCSFSWCCLFQPVLFECVAVCALCIFLSSGFFHYTITRRKRSCAGT